MNRKNHSKIISFIQTLIYLIAFLVCFFTVYSFAGKVNPDDGVREISFRVMTYNIHHGEGIDGVVDFHRIADVINQINPDILLLQEVDINLERSGNVDVPVLLSEFTELKSVVFGKNLDVYGGEYGNATLSRFPITSARNFQFKKIGPEQRGVLATEISVMGQNLLVINSHFDHSEKDSERTLYSEKITHEILPKYNVDAVLFGGDFNDIPTSRMYKKLSDKFKDAWVISGKGEGFTIPAHNPSKRIDYILFDGILKTDSIWIPKKEASDHLPVVADFLWIDEE